MTKYDYELKKRVVTAYLNGEGGYKFISKKYDISDKLHVKNKSQIMTWLIWYKMVIEIVSSLQIIIFYKFFFLGQNKINHIQRM